MKSLLVLTLFNKTVSTAYVTWNQMR